MTEEIAKIKANKDGTYIDIVPEKCVSAQKAQYDENGRDLLDAESSQTIKGANTFAAKQTLTGGVAVSGTSAIAGNVNMDSGAVTIGSAVTVENHGKITADNTANVIKAANHNSVLTSNDVLTAKDINEVNGKANNLVHRSGAFEQRQSKIGLLNLASGIAAFSNEGTSRELFRITPITGQSNRISMLVQVSSSNNTRLCYGILEIILDSGGTITAINSTKTILVPSYTTPISLGVTKNGDGTISVSSSTYGATSCIIMASYTGSRFVNSNFDYTNLGATVATVDFTQSW